MRRSNRYPTRSTVSRAPNSGAVGGTVLAVPERRSERARSQTERLGISAQATHDYSRIPQHNNHQPNPSHQFHAMYRGHSQTNSHIMSNGPICSVPNLQMNSHSMNHQIYRQSQTNYLTNPGFSMPIINETTMRRGDVRFIKLNSYEDMKILIRTKSINQGGANVFHVNDVAPFLSDDHYRVFLRFCKYSSSVNEQNDCLPKSFNLVIGTTAFQVKNKYTFAPYDITTRVACEKNNEVLIKITFDANSSEANEDFYFGLFLVKKVDHKKLLANFRTRSPHDIKLSLDLVKRKLTPDDDDSDEISIVESSNQIKVSLLCPLSSTRIKVPARSKYCDHIHCFDAESFININEITPRWKCPICKIYIKLDDMIIDSLFLNILREAPPDVTEADIFEDGRFEYFQETKPVISSNSTKTSTSTNKSSSTQESNNKRKLEESPSSEKKSSVKLQKVESEIEYITIDSDDETNSDTITSSHSDSTDSSGSSNEKSTKEEDSDSDSDIEIVYEKIAPPPKISSNSRTQSSGSGNSKSSTPNSNSNSASNVTTQTTSSSFSQPTVATASMPTFIPNNNNNPSCMFSSNRYTGSNMSESHRLSNQYVPQMTNPQSSHQSNMSHEMMSMYGMFKYPGNMNCASGSYSSAPSTSSNYCNGQSSSSNVNSYLPSNSNPYSSTAGTSSSTSMTTSSRPNQSLLRYPPNYMDSFLNNQMPSSSMLGSNNTPHTQAMDLTATLANMKTDGVPDFDNFDNNFSWFNPQSKDSNDYNYTDKSSRPQRSETEVSPVVENSQSMSSNFPNFHQSS